MEPTATVRLHYFKGRGLGEAVRFALAAAGVEWEDCFVRERADMEALLASKKLLFEQLPLLESPGGTSMVQTGAILRYIGWTHDLMGSSDIEATRIDQLVEGALDFGGKCPGWASDAARAALDGKMEALRERWLPRYGGAFEAQLAAGGPKLEAEAATGGAVGSIVVIHGLQSAPQHNGRRGKITGQAGERWVVKLERDGDEAAKLKVKPENLGGVYLVGTKLSIADTTLLRFLEEIPDWLGEETARELLSKYPLLWAWRERMLAEPRIAAYMAGPQRNPCAVDRAVGDAYVGEVRASMPSGVPPP